MKALEFETTMSNAGQIVLPAEFAGDIPAGQRFIMWEAGPADSEWYAMGRARFEGAHCAEDDIYGATHP